MYTDVAGAECMQRLDGFGKGYDCFCKSGYHGELCDMETNACSAQPCHGLATCHAEPGGLFTCFCPPTHTGEKLSGLGYIHVMVSSDINPTTFHSRLSLKLRVSIE